jgi:glycosyltransferase involved in cell wall biosynthesis
LVHEFPQYIGVERLTRLIENSERLIFSSRLLTDAAAGAAGHELARATILPQGKSIIPHKSAFSTSPRDTAGVFAPEGTLLCIGCGYVQMRKGVDIFITVAIEVLRRGVNARFVWIGDGYDPDGDLRLGVWLKDQIERSGQADRISIVPSLPGDQLEEVYDRADLMFLSSRLDPLPNVAIDAMTAGVPVICFEKATGLTEYLNTDPELIELTVPYLDLHTAAQRIVEIGCNAKKRCVLGERSRKFAHDHFNMDNYARLIGNHVLQVEAASKEKSSCLVS